MSIELKVKAYTLAEEARYIRKQEVLKRNQARSARKGNFDAFLPEWERHKLYIHRVKVVRPEARLTHIARAYIKGKPYRTVETASRKGKQLREADIKRITDMVGRYSSFFQVLPQDVEAWVKGAEANPAGYLAG